MLDRLASRRSVGVSGCLFDTLGIAASLTLFVMKVRGALRGIAATRCIKQVTMLRGRRDKRFSVFLSAPAADPVDW